MKDDIKNTIGHVNILSDSEVIERILQGEKPLFEVLIRRYNPVLYRIARSYGFGHHDAEDLMQETHLSAYSGLDRFEHRSAYKTWLSRIMIRKCGKKSASGYTKHEIPAGNFQEESELKHQPAISGSKDILSKETLKIIEQSLEQIPPIYRSVFILREVEGFSVAETAELLSITATNVKVRLNRCKALLQRQLEQVFTSPEIYEFNLVFCDRIVARVFEMISKVVSSE